MERRISEKAPEQPDATLESGKQEASRRLARASQADVSQPASPAKTTEQEQLRLPLEGKRSTDKAEITGKVSDARLPSEGLKTEKAKIIPCEPSAIEQQKILTRANKWSERDLRTVKPNEWTNREREALGVEGTIYQMEKSGQYTDFVRLGGPNRADVLCLERRGRLVVAECKGHTAMKATDAGYLNERGEASGDLASTRQEKQLKLFEEPDDKQLFENSGEWLEDNRTSMQNALQDRIHTNASDRASCERVLAATRRTDFTNTGSYERVVGTVGPEARFGNVEEYIRKVKPAKLFEVNMRVLETNR